VKLTGGIKLEKQYYLDFGDENYYPYKMCFGHSTPTFTICTLDYGTHYIVEFEVFGKTGIERRKFNHSRKGKIKREQFIDRFYEGVEIDG
jgi:hypothetical protein